MSGAARRLGFITLDLCSGVTAFSAESPSVTVPVGDSFTIGVYDAVPTKPEIAAHTRPEGSHSPSGRSPIRLRATKSFSGNPSMADRIGTESKTTKRPM